MAHKGCKGCDGCEKPAPITFLGSEYKPVLYHGELAGYARGKVYISVVLAEVTPRGERWEAQLQWNDVEINNIRKRVFKTAAAALRDLEINCKRLLKAFGIEKI